MNYSNCCKAKQSKAKQMLDYIQQKTKVVEQDKLIRMFDKMPSKWLIQKPT